jgi:hypothetical protein
MVSKSTVNEIITQKKDTPSSVVEISFGYGGGFTGEVHTYRILPNGQLLSENQIIKTIDKDVCEQFFRQAEQFLDYKCNKPNNMYNFLEISTLNKHNRIVWGASEDGISPQVLEFYKVLNSLKKQ